MRGTGRLFYIGNDRFEMHLLEVKNLITRFKTADKVVKAVDGISYHIDESEIIGLVGESGCGKSVSQLSVMQLIPTPPGEIADGQALFEGRDLLRLDPKGKEMCSIRGGKISMIFQEPMTSLNPVLSVGRQLTEMLEIHLHLDRKEARTRAIDLVQAVGIPDPGKRLADFPHQFSGGMRQRIMIAMALSCRPKLVIADEPTTALDVTTQAKILELMTDLVRRFRTSLVLVTHNLGVVARYVQRIYVMYAGRIVESGTAKDIFGRPGHPYTIGLLKCVPRLDDERKAKLVPIPGSLPDPAQMASTCAFLPRCSYAGESCRKEPWADLRLVEGEHYTSCRMDVCT
jgi:peptide/nickel transport system ATP-binding protein